jgi:hypothetical protein
MRVVRTCLLSLEVNEAVLMLDEVLMVLDKYWRSLCRRFAMGSRNTILSLFLTRNCLS